MAEPPEFWLFVLSNLLVLITGGALTALSYRAYRRMDHEPLRGAVVGFGLITLGALVEAVYELGIRGSYELSGRELLALHTVEGVIITLGLVTVFYAVTKY